MILTHGNGYSTLYGHLAGFNVRDGQRVGPGQVIRFRARPGTPTRPPLPFATRPAAANPPTPRRLKHPGHQQNHFPPLGTPRVPAREQHRPTDFRGQGPGRQVFLKRQVPEANLVASPHHDAAIQFFLGQKLLGTLALLCDRALGGETVVRDQIARGDPPLQRVGHLPVASASVASQPSNLPPIASESVFP